MLSGRTRWLRIPAACLLVLPAALDAAGAGDASPGGHAAARGPAPEEPPDAYARALTHYRARRYAEAESVLAEAIRKGAGGRGYRSLLGWCHVQQQEFTEGAAAFREAMKEEPGSVEARQGLAAALAGAGDPEGALDYALPLLAEDPRDEVALGAATRALAASGRVRDRRLERAAVGGAPRVVARAGKDYLEVRWGGSFVPVFVKGVNLGVALPGRFPAEFPEDVAIYRKWLDQIAVLGANAVRLYTLLPPAFYQALHEHNRTATAGDPGKAPPRGFIWLIQGVWTELPESDRYDDPAFEGPFREEMDRIADVIHGKIAVARRPGHAFGAYTFDVSAMTLAWILGREWEPYSVDAYDSARPGGRFRGRYFVLEEGTAMEAWLASMMEHVVAYEARHHGDARPVAFTNWPTLDPLRHPTEATKAEESALARRLGLPFGDRAVREYDNDGVGIDTNRIRATPEAPAGQFASYHAYPYYPDFMNLDPGYLRARDRHGPSNYAGYLADLRKHHAGLPVLISEIGVPTSRGVSHVQPQGFNHGGHNEAGQGEVDARLMETIHDTGCAGGVLFAWIDEWFKRNWLVMEFESPAERNVKWLNVLDPEQNYGLIAARPGRGGAPVVLDAAADDWAGKPPLLRGGGAAGAGGSAPEVRLKALYASHDEAYLYLRLDVDGWQAGDGGRDAWERARFMIGIDTYGESEGDRRFPSAPDIQAPTGMEFVAEISGTSSSRLLVDAPYDLNTHRYNRPYRSVANDDGRYVEILAETNRRRIGRDGTLYPEIVHNRSPLLFGTTDPNAAAYDDLADWFADPRTGIIEIRLAWGLLNVTDPSSRRVLDDPPAFVDEVGTRVTDGFRIYAAAVDPRGGRVLDTLPARGADGRISPKAGNPYTWPGWEEPTFHLVPKRSYFILKQRLAALPDVVAR